MGSTPDGLPALLVPAFRMCPVVGVEPVRSRLVIGNIVGIDGGYMFIAVIIELMMQTQCEQVLAPPQGLFVTVAGGNQQDESSGLHIT